jgi:ribosomal protein L11 methyltransferase
MIRLAVRCSPEYAEPVLANLLELAPNGVEEERGPDWIEFAIYGPPGEVPDVGELQAAAGGGLVEVTTTTVPDDWADRWADFHKPIVVGNRISVRPSWWDPNEGMIDVVIDPGRAFGTGGHPTTRLSLALLLELADDSASPSGAAPAPAGTSRGRERPLPDAAGLGPLADWGTGSGVLAIAAGKLGWGPITACDREPASLEAAVANAEANGVGLKIARVDVREGPPPVAPTVVANLTAQLLLECARHLGESGELPHRLVCSGMLTEEADGVAEAFAVCGLEQVERRTDGDWTALLLRS